MLRLIMDKLQRSKEFEATSDLEQAIADYAKVFGGMDHALDHLEGFIMSQSSDERIEQFVKRLNTLALEIHREREGRINHHKQKKMENVVPMRASTRNPEMGWEELEL